ncbi:RNA polymerase sigma factor [Paenibacillus planticolens]|uniref:RNA polymerase sigma factor n=1 Tax=Paenibacillus planticolens TaxID=2654976 RepID=UPI0035E41710
MYRLALFLTKSRTLSEDIMQDTFIQVFQVYPQYDSTRPIQPWIYKITLNTVRKTLRKRHWTTLWNRQHKNESLEEIS